MNIHLANWDKEDGWIRYISISFVRSSDQCTGQTVNRLA